ncbi:MAG: retropepsin-like domain-containing protein [bacterium]|nr:retropepsin-like domain-containing protein [bacterium]
MPKLRHPFRFLLPTLLLLAAAPAMAVNLHLLVEQADGVALETVAVPGTGELVVTRPDLVTVVLPFGLGQSGDLVPKSRRPARLVARLEGGQLRVEITGADGRGRALPPVAVADLARLDLRVNVTGSGGRQRAFVVRANGPAAAASGPVLDMFGGKIPLAPGDWALTTETTEHARAGGLAGVVPCRWRDGLVFTQVTGPDGRRGRFVIDTAAGVTVLARGFLPKSAVIEPIEGVEHSEKGARVVPGAMSGAGGEVAGLLGACEPGTLRLGELSVDGVRANVMAALPELGGAPVDGILGLDVLSRCGLLRLERGADGEGTLAFDPQPTAPAAGAINCPFSIVAKHIVLPAQLDGTDVSLVLDTGARGSLLPSALAAKAGLSAASGTAAREFRGLDGRPLPARPVQVQRLALGGAAAGPAVFHAGDLPALAALGLDGNSGLLGGDVLAAWRRLEIDFAANVVRLTR